MQGKSINGFTLQRLLGQGGMGEVWYAENEIGMKAAVKILSEELTLNAQMKERFLREAKVMVKLDHPNIRKVFGFGVIDDRPAIIMEYLDGEDLRTRMKLGQRFQQEELEKWWNQLVLALSYISQKGVVHRDIKPGNLFVDTQGNVKLLDFGIAKEKDGISLTQTGSLLGTLIYMSPEQVKDPKRVGPASDVYSLAVSFVHLLTGKAPYDKHSNSDYEIQESIVRKPLDLSGVPDEWRGFLMPYLAKKPEDRPPLMNFVPVKTGIDETTQMVEVSNDQPKPRRKVWPTLLVVALFALIGIVVGRLIISGKYPLPLLPKDKSVKTVLDTFDDFVKRGESLLRLVPNEPADTVDFVHFMESIALFDSALEIQKSHPDEIANVQDVINRRDSLMVLRKTWFKGELESVDVFLDADYIKDARLSYKNARILALPESPEESKQLEARRKRLSKK